MSSLTIDTLPDGYTVVQDEYGGHWIRDPNGHVMTIPEMTDFLKNNHLVHEPPPKDSGSSGISSILIIGGVALLLFILYKLLRKS